MPTIQRSRNIREGLYEYHLRIHLLATAKEHLKGQKYVDCGRYIYQLLSYCKKTNSLEDIEKIRDDLLVDYRKLGFCGMQGRRVGGRRRNIYINKLY
tara:strand:- start:732 stop:1022 length:291 start_codon:yes stop_codon:yes gene_type:complete